MTAVDSTSSWNCCTDVSVNEGVVGSLPVESSRATAKMFSSRLMRVVERAVIRAITCVSKQSQRHGNATVEKHRIEATGEWVRLLHREIHDSAIPCRNFAVGTASEATSLLVVVDSMTARLRKCLS